MNHKIVHIVPPFERNRSSWQPQKGYVLLAVMLLITLMMIAMSVELPRIAQQVKREKEEELVHRGMDYARAVKRFYHKSNTYPSSIEQLKDTNHIRFLRKEYKDPITGESDWKLVHMNEAEIKIPQGTGVQGLQGSSPGLTGANGGQPAGTAGLNPSSAGAAGGTGFSGGGTGLSGGTGFSGGGTGLSGGGTGLSGGGTGLSGGGTGLSGSGSSLSGSSTGLTGSTQNAAGQGSGSAQGGAAQQGGSGALQTSNIGLGNSGPSQIGGGQIIGFASTSKKNSIKEFNDKDEYDQWYFVYDPRLEQTGPNQMGSADAGLIIAAPRGGAAGQGTPGALTGSQPTQPNRPSPAGSASPQVPQ
jgi:type II secretory pathway pseudopilin PulG